MSELTASLRDYLPDDFENKVEDADYGEETAAKNYVVPILRELGLEHANYEEIIESGDRPDFIWSDSDGIDRVVGELKKPWDENNSSSDKRYKIKQGIEEAEIYNEQLRLKYILVSDGRYILLRNEYAEPKQKIEIDLLKLYQNPSNGSVENDVSQLQSWITELYEGEWNDNPSQRDISDDKIFGEFIEASRSALNEDILPSIERRFEKYEERWEIYTEKRQEKIQRQEELQETYRSQSQWSPYKEAIDNVAADLGYDYESKISGASTSSEDRNEDKWINMVAEFRDELLSIETEISDLKSEYKYAIEWNEKWQRWLDITAKDYEGVSNNQKEKIRETFQLQTLNVLYNRLLLIRTFEDMGIIGQVISDGFMKFFDEKVSMRENQYIEPLTTATRQAEEVYSPLFRRNTPHDWYHWEEPVLRTVLRRFDNFNFKNINRDIFGVMYQKCLDTKKRKKLGAYYTPPEAIEFLLDYSDFSEQEINIKSPDEKILDPACGSGTFILEATNRVLDSMKNSGYDFQRDEDLLKAIDKINNKIKGFDIDPFAVQLAQSNLLIRVLQERQNGTKDDTHLEFPSFSVFETDSLITSKESLDDKEIHRFYRARENDAENINSIMAAKENKYSWVVGNPPYVSARNQDDDVTGEYERLHDTFGDKQSDLFIGFVEQALDWLEDGGRLAFVISNKLLVNEGSEDLMKYILDNSTIDLVCDMTRCKLFGFKVNVFPILIVLTKRSGDKYHEKRKENKTQVMKVFAKGGRESNEWAHALNHAATEVIPWRDNPDYDFRTDFESEDYPDITNRDTYDTYKVPQSRFTDDWGDWSNRLSLNFHINEKLWEAVKEIENRSTCKPLSQICKVDEDGTPYGAQGRGIEPNKYRKYTSDTATTPVVKSRNIESFYLGDTKADVKYYIDIDSIKDDNDSKVSSNKLDAFINEAKIAYAKNSPSLSFVVDDPEDTTRFYDQTGYFLLMRDTNTIDSYNTEGEQQDSERDGQIDLYYLTGLLNSDVLDFYYKAYYEHKSTRHSPAMETLPSYLHHLPIYIPNKDEKEKIKGLSKNLHENKRKQKRLNYKLETLFEKYEQDNKTVDFRTKISSVVDSRSNYNIKTFTVSREGSMVELNRYHTVEMQNEEEAKKLASFLQEFGDEYIGGDKLRNLKLPKDMGDFSKEYHRIKAELSSVSSQIDSDMSELNDAVYDLYGLNAYRDDIQEYLDSFLKVIS
jgi:hypothetical protein